MITQIINFIKEANASTSHIFNNGVFSFIIVLVVLLISSLILTRIVKGFFKRYGEKRKCDCSFLSTLVCGVIYILAAYGVLDQIIYLHSIALSLLAGSGVVAVVIGLAAQESFGNLISGIMIVIYRPISVGDHVKINEITGIVEEISLRHTVIKTYQNNRTVVPNIVVNTSVIENLSMTDTKMCNFFEMRISYEADVEKAMKIMEEEISSHPKYVDVRTEEEKKSGAPKVTMRCVSIGLYDIIIRAMVWSETMGDGFAMSCDLRLKIKERFAKEGIEIPYPYTNVIINNKEMNKNENNLDNAHS